MSDAKSHYWDTVYTSRISEQLSWYQASPQRSLQIIEALNLQARCSVIDVGGGASVLVDSLIDRGFESLTVLDISAKAINISKQRLADKADKVDWLVSDITQFSPGRKYQLWHDRAVFHFLTKEQDQAVYLDTLKQSLTPGGYIILATFALGGPERCSGLPVEQYDAEKIMGRLGKEFILLSTEYEKHVTPAGDEQLFNYFCIQYQPG